MGSAVRALKTAARRVGVSVSEYEARIGARPMHPHWARSLRDQCAAAGVPFFMKQINKIEPIPADLLVREFPNAHA